MKEEKLDYVQNNELNEEKNESEYSNFENDEYETEENIVKNYIENNIQQNEYNVLCSNVNEDPLEREIKDNIENIKKEMEEFEIHNNFENEYLLNNFSALKNFFYKYSKYEILPGSITKWFEDYEIALYVNEYEGPEDLYDYFHNFNCFKFTAIRKYYSNKYNKFFCILIIKPESLFFKIPEYSYEEIFGKGKKYFKKEELEEIERKNNFTDYQTLYLFLKNMTIYKYIDNSLNIECSNSLNFTFKIMIPKLREKYLMDYFKRIGFDVLKVESNKNIKTITVSGFSQAIIEGPDYIEEEKIKKEIKEWEKILDFKKLIPIAIAFALCMGLNGIIRIFKGY